MRGTPDVSLFYDGELLFKIGHRVPISRVVEWPKGCWIHVRIHPNFTCSEVFCRYGTHQ